MEGHFEIRDSYTKKYLTWMYKFYFDMRERDPEAGMFNLAETWVSTDSCLSHLQDYTLHLQRTLIFLKDFEERYLNYHLI